MFNSKALWWTSLGFWLAGSIYWHICKIEQYCDVLLGSKTLFSEIPPQQGQLYFSLRSIGLPTYHFELTHFWQHAIIIGVALLLGFMLGTTYEMRKTRDLRYRLNRIRRELAYYESKP